MGVVKAGAGVMEAVAMDVGVAMEGAETEAAVLG